MRNLVQARLRIWESIDSHGGATAVANATRPSPDDAPAVSPSMLFKFRAASGPLLGKDSVNALRLVLDDVDAETWLAAMGVDVQAAEASA